MPPKAGTSKKRTRAATDANIESAPKSNAKKQKPSEEISALGAASKASAMPPKSMDSGTITAATAAPASSPTGLEWITLPTPPYERELRRKAASDDDENEDDGDEEPSEAEIAEGKAEFNKYYKKPLADNPEWPWVVSRKAWKEYSRQTIEIQKRDQDNFGMHIYNDWTGYGMQEVVENILVGFNAVASKKNADPLEVWTHIEVLAHFFVNEDLVQWGMIDDSNRVRDTWRLVGAAILRAMRKLKVAGLLTATGPVKDLSLVLALFFHVLPDFAEILADYDTEDYSRWIGRMILYAEENGIEIKGLTGIEETVKEYKDEAEERIDMEDLVYESTYTATYRAFVRTYGVGNSRRTIGGKRYDITKMSKAERKKASFDGKDPLAGMGPLPEVEDSDWEDID